MKRFWKRRFLALLVLTIFLATAAWVSLTWIWTRPPSFHPTIELGAVELRTWSEHDAMYQQTEFPYALTLENSRGALDYIGVRHTSNAADAQLTEVERRWSDFRPTVALCEGRARMFRFASRPDTGSLNESQLTRILAQRSGVPLYSLEPTYSAEVTGLLEHFEPKLVATYMTLRVYTSEADPTKTNQDALARNLLRKRTDVNGLRNTLSTIAELDAYWEERFPGEPDWRTLPDTEQTPLLVEVGNASRMVRGEHMVRSLVELVNRGERVFAVVGASHVIRQEPALRKHLESPASDMSQPSMKDRDD